MSIDEALLKQLATIAGMQHHGQVMISGISMNITNWRRLPFARLHNTSGSSNVTCCVPFGNDHAYLEEALSSVSYQSLRPDRILVGVDNCISKTPATFGQSIEIHYFEGHNGPFAIVDSLIRMTKSEYILIMDSDDISHPDRLSILLQCAISTGSEIVGSAVANFNEGSDEIYSLGIFPLRPYYALAEGLCHSMLYPTTLIRRSAYLDVGGFSSFDIFGMDTDFIVRVAYRRQAINLFLPLYAKRRRLASLTEQEATGMRSNRRAKILGYTLQRHHSLYFGGREQGQ